MEMGSGARCRRCGAEVAGDADRFMHVLPLDSETGVVHVVELLMCVPCGTGFPTLRDRDEYARLVYFG